MRLSLFLLAGLMFATITWALTPQNPSFVPCEKTYISPQEIALEETTIHIKTESLSGKTSAIYSDSTGLYYTDFLEDIKEISIACEDDFEKDPFSIHSDKPSPIFNDEPQIFIPDESSVIEKSLLLVTEESLPISEPSPIIQEEIAPSSAHLQPQQPSRLRSSWPYFEKKR